jgi:hypothetical protein
MNIQQSLTATAAILIASGGPRCLLAKAPRPASPIFLLGVVGIILVLIGAVFLGMAALLRDLRPRKINSAKVRHRSLA